VRPFGDFRLGAEYSSGWDSENGSAERDDAWRINLQGSAGDRARVYLEKTRAGSDFPGFFRDVDYTRATLLFSVLQNLRLNTSFAEDRSNLDSDPARSAAPREQRYHVDLTYYFPTNTYLSLAYGHEDRKDILAPRDFDDEARRLALVVGHSFRRASLRASAGPLRVHDNLTDRSTTQLAYRADVGLSPTARQRYSAFFARGHEGLTADPDLEKTLGLSASYEVAQRLSFDARYEKRGLGEAGMETDQILADLRYTFRHGHTLSIEARYLDYREPEIDEVTVARNIDRLEYFQQWLALVPGHVTRAVHHVVPFQRTDGNESYVGDAKLPQKFDEVLPDSVVHVLFIRDHIHLVNSHE